MASAKKSTAVATKKTAAIIPLDAAMPDHLKKGTARGSENVTSNDVAIPRLEMIQSLSPQRKKNDAKYIEGAEEGMIFHTVTGELCDQPVMLVPVTFEKQYLAWRDRKKGGGFGGAFETMEAAQDSINQKDEPEDWEVLDTHQHFCLWMKENGQLEPIVLSMSKSKMTPSRQWNALIRGLGGDRFSRVYALEVVEKQNANGESYYNWKVSPVGYAPENVYNEAEKLWEALQSQKRSAHYAEDESYD